MWTWHNRPLWQANKGKKWSKRGCLHTHNTPPPLHICTWPVNILFIKSMQYTKLWYILWILDNNSTFYADLKFYMKKHKHKDHFHDNTYIFCLAEIHKYLNREIRKGKQYHPFWWQVQDTWPNTYFTSVIIKLRIHVWCWQFSTKFSITNFNL